MNGSRIFGNNRIGSFGVRYNDTVIANNGEKPELSQVTDMYIAGNEGGGVVGIPVSFSTIIGNKGPGVFNSTGVLGCNIAFNEGPGVENCMVSNSYVKGNRGGEALDSEITFPSTEPRTEAPPFLMQILPDEEFPLGIGSAGFELTFSANMITTRQPEVSFGQSTPFTLYILSASPGWIDGQTWRGAFNITNEVPDGTHTLRVARALAADGFLIPPDTYHRFRVDKQGGLQLNNGRVIARTHASLTIAWDPSADTDVIGAHVVRARVASGPYRGVASVTGTVTEFMDSGLQSETTYFYQIYEYDSELNNRQLTRPFGGTTLGGFGPTETPTFLPTPSPTFNHDLWPIGGDDQVDARDLLELLRGANDQPIVFFDFVRHWMNR